MHTIGISNFFAFFGYDYLIFQTVYISIHEDVDASNMNVDSLDENNVWIVALGEDDEKDVAIGEVTFLGNPLDNDEFHVGQDESQDGVNISVSDNGEALKVNAQQGEFDISGTLNIDFADAEGSHEFNQTDNVEVNIAGSDE